MTALEQHLLMLLHDVRDARRSTRDIRDAATARVVDELGQTIEKLVELILESESRKQ